MEGDNLTPVMVEIVKNFSAMRNALIQYGCHVDRIDAALKPAMDEALEMMRDRQRTTGLGHIGG